MRNILILFAFFTLIIVSCKKSSHDDSGCIERLILPVTAHGVNSSTVAIIDNLFSSNGIDNRNYRYYHYYNSPLQTQYPPFAIHDQKIVRVDQYTNGLRILNGDLVYNFINDVYNHSNGRFTNGTSLNTIPNLSLDRVRKLFFESAAKFDSKGKEFEKTCLKAEFGYYNVNAGISNSQEELIKAWRVTPKNTSYPSDYPRALIRDGGNGSLIYYDNGIRTSY